MTANISMILKSRQGFNRQSNKTNGNGTSNANQQKGTSSQNSSPTTHVPPMPPLNTSTSPSSVPGSNSDNGSNNGDAQIDVEPTKFFFREKYARLGVKGNFMPLAAQPKNVDLGEWLAHQGLYAISRNVEAFVNVFHVAVEQYRLVEALLQCVQEVDSNTGLPICNAKSCPVMSAGR